MFTSCCSSHIDCASTSGLICIGGFDGYSTGGVRYLNRLTGVNGSHPTKSFCESYRSSSRTHEREVVVGRCVKYTGRDIRHFSDGQCRS